MNIIMLKEIDILVSQSIVSIVNCQVFMLIEIRIRVNRVVTHFIHVK